MKYSARAKLDNKEIKGDYTIMELLAKIEGMVKGHVKKEEGC